MILLLLWYEVIKNTQKFPLNCINTNVRLYKYSSYLLLVVYIPLIRSPVQYFLPFERINLKFT